MIEDVAKVECLYSMDFDACGHDMDSMLYSLLDTCLYHFNAEPFFIGRVCRVLKLRRGDGPFDERRRLIGLSNLA